MREYRQHRYILDQHLRDQRTESGCLCQAAEMAHQDRAKAQSLIWIDDRKSHFGYAEFDDDKSSTSNNGVTAVLIRHRDKRDVGPEVNGQEIVQLYLCQLLSRSKETPKKRFRACAGYGFKEGSAIIRPNGADLDMTAIAKRFHRRIVRKTCHGR